MQDGMKQIPGGDWIAEEGKGERARGRILAAARKVFAQNPYRSASTRLIAEAAGIERPLIHYYFGSKEKLFEAVAKQMFEEFNQAHLSFLEGVERLPPREGLSLYLDRLLDYTLQHPEPMRVILVNMPQIGNLDEIPGYQYIPLHLEELRHLLEHKVSLRGPANEIQMFFLCFNNLVINFLGAKSCQAQVLGLDPESPEYRQWIKEALLTLFAPWLEKLISPPTGRPLEA